MLGTRLLRYNSTVTGKESSDILSVWYFTIHMEISVRLEAA